MGFPDDRLPIQVEFAFGADLATDPDTWEWTDVTGSLHSQTISITRGRANESAHVQPTSASVVLDNSGGDYTPDHPLSRYWPHVDQGTPARVSVYAGTPWLETPGDGGAQTPVTEALRITGDIDVRLDADLDDWHPEDTVEVAGRYQLTDDQRSWLIMLEDGRPYWRWSADGATYAGTFATEDVPLTSGRLCLRFTLETATGTVRFYTADSLAGPWAMLGEPVVIAGAPTSIHPGTAPLAVGDIPTLGFAPTTGRIHALEVRDGIDGALVADLGLDRAEPSATTWTSSTGLTWSVTDLATLSNKSVRLMGQADSWEPSWPYGDLSSPDGRDPGEARTTVTIAGPLRRMQQGTKALDSTLRRRIPSDPSLVAYWPMEDARGASRAYSPIEGVLPMTTSGLSFAADDSLAGSSALPTLGETATFTGYVPDMPSGQWHVEFVYNLAEHPTSIQWVVDVYTTNPTARVLHVLLTPAGIQVIREDYEGVTDLVINRSAPEFAGQWNRFQLFAQPSGSSTQLTLRWVPIGGIGWRADETMPGAPGRVTRVVKPHEFGDQLSGTPIGHLSVFSEAGTTAYNDADHGFTGETAGERLVRLCSEEGVDLVMLGDPADTAAMGPQEPAPLLDLLRECAEVDGGILGEQRARLGLRYRTRTTRYNQAPTLQLDAQRSEITNPFRPTKDDRGVRNDVEVSRRGGSTARAIDEESIARRGRYDTSLTVNAASDDQLPDLAGWELHLGTWPGMRYPSVSMDLVVAPHLITAWLGVDSGDRVTVTGLPPQHPAGTVDLLAEGYTETLSPTRWNVKANCSPAGPWDVGYVDDPVLGRVDTDGSALVAAVGEADTTLHVGRTGEWPLWTEDPADYPMDLAVGGEVVTATACQPVAADAFARTVTGGWGVADTGQAWVLAGGSDSERSVDGTSGVVGIPSDPSVIRFQYLPETLGDCEVLASISPSVIATGASLIPGILLRYSGTGTYYRTRIHFGTDAGVTLAIAVGTSQTASTSLPGTYSAGSVWWVRARVTGTLIQARAWADGAPEPGHWQIAYDDTDNTSPVGSAGVTASAFASNTNASPTIRFGAVTVLDPQVFTVTRSATGITKAHPVGADVRLARATYTSI